MKKTTQYSKWAAVLLTSALSLTLTAQAFGAPLQAGLKPSWTSASLFTSSVLVPKDAESVIHDVKAVPAKKQVYVHMGQNVPNTTSKTKQLWYVDTLKALDADTGKQNWEYVFHDSKGPYTTAGSSVFNSNGTAYVYQAFSDKTYRLYSVNSSGKLNWVQSLTGPSSISLLKDGSILAASPSAPDSKGIVKTTLTQFDVSGKVTKRQQVPGNLLTAQGDRIILSTSPLVKNSAGIWLDKLNPRLEVYDLSFKSLYSYQVPAGSNIYGDGSPGQMVLNDGTVILRTNVNGTGNKLQAFNSQGSQLWERNIPGSALTQSTGSGYVVFANGTMTLYDLEKNTATRTFDEEESKYTVITHTGDGKLSVNLKDNTYLLNPTSLEEILSFNSGSLNPLMTTYGDNAVYASSADGKLTKLAVKAGK
ncbi:hypothetical protein A8L34_05645 [Bacillus sp. FJAT-27264]|uniref:outer membrane protein assembly factor BamB family protein n=1 Tax=Paenibacillus sp. (strain DSM 101736 / FJAT-27264) TaxID=1850362 RepID=UPI000807EF15|nr:PQQ-binding-like beta-propeller repeat protein [Bacillus sp. FJAT-27264]OBZ19025.1 hypothetical protein A8L34_05645 [Bacillus sp. FJAT-27264]